MYIVYVIRSAPAPDKIYIGYTQDIKKRLSNHNCGTTESTSRYAPWNLITYVYFTNKDTAVEFEKYLKSGSGRAFLAKRLL